MSRHHAILGIEKDASKEVVDAAYRKLAKQYHPDKNQGDPTAASKFSEIAEARSAIIDTLEGKVSEGAFDYTLTLFPVHNVFGQMVSLRDEEFRVGAGLMPDTIYSVIMDSGEEIKFLVKYDGNQDYKVEGRNLRRTLTVNQETIDKSRKVSFLNHSGVFYTDLLIDKDAKTGDVLTAKGQGLVNKDGPNGDLLVDIVIIPRKPPRSKVPLALVLTALIALYLYVTQGHL